MSTEEPRGPEDMPSAEELAMAMVERLGRTRVQDVLMQTMATFTDMAGIRLGFGPQGEGPRDLAQARLALEALRGLLAVAERELGPAAARPFREPLAALQLAYAREAEGGAPAAAPEGGPAAAPEGGPAAAGPPPPPPPPRNPDPASRLWTPPGARRPRGDA